MVAATLSQASLDVVAKGLGTNYPIAQLVWFRYSIHLLVVVVFFAPRLGWSLLKTNILTLQLVRSSLLVTLTGLFFLGLQHVPIAEATALLYVAPLITVLLAKPFLKEPRSTSALVAAAAGFLGVVAVTQPLSGEFSLAWLLPLGAALTLSLYMIATRRIGGRDSATTTWFFTGVVGLVVTTPFIPFVWTNPATITDLLLLLSLGGFGGIGHLLIIKAHQRSSASTLAPLGYSELLFVSIIGLFAFQEVPGMLSVIGMGLIVIGGIAALLSSPPVRIT